MKLEVRIYRSSKTAEMYLYVNRDTDLEDIPEDLMSRFGKPIEVMELELTPDRALARAEVRDVMTQVTEKGFYLQMPPIIEANPSTPAGAE